MGNEVEEGGSLGSGYAEGGSFREMKCGWAGYFFIVVSRVVSDAIFCVSAKNHIEKVGGVFRRLTRTPLVC
jgi:hypothetical protein